jgi:hypothetical protein
VTQQEVEAIRRAAKLAGELSTMASVAGPMLRELEALLQGIASRPAPSVVETIEQSAKLNG